jgi:ParB-like chromosome segregation protein Spo0J
MPVHPAAELFPMMSETEFQAMKEDIRIHGQNDDVLIWNGKLLDGRNRLRACTELGIEPGWSELPKTIDPVAWVLSHNLHRRHLTTSQRGMVATKLATLLQGEKKTDAGIQASSQIEAAEKLNVSRDSVQKARKVKQKATPEVVAAVESGTMSLNAAVATTKPKATQAEKDAAKAAKDKAKADAAAEREAIKAAKAAEKAAAEKAKAEAKAAKEAAKAAALTTEGQAKNIANLIQQHIDKAVRLVDDLAHLRPVSHAKKMAVIKTLQGVKLW